MSIEVIDDYTNGVKIFCDHTIALFTCNLERDNIFWNMFTLHIGRQIVSSAVTKKMFISSHSVLGKFHTQFLPDVMTAALRK
jgi:hypothetical protein